MLIDMGANRLYRGDLRLRDPLHCRIKQYQARATMHLWVGRLKDKPTLTATEKRRIRTIIQLREAFARGDIGMKLESE